MTFEDVFEKNIILKNRQKIKRSTLNTYLNYQTRLSRIH